ncbi:transcription elongation factor GreA [Candidatus Uhrbacteria bacterium]|nr:transcription elongation factor GreA [Candidatus Uhrbacteria bacterium]
MAHYLTKEGLEKLKADLDQMRNVARKEVIERIAAAKELGDLKENAEYAEAKDDQAMLESRIAEYEQILKQAIIIDEKSGVQTRVSIGSTVSVKCGENLCTYTIVGSEEADPITFRISHESPLGRSFLNKQVGESVLVKVPKGEFEYVIMEIK